MTQTFKATAQYDDWVGTVAADNHGDRTLSDLLSDRNLLSEGEVAVGISFYSGENGFISASVYVVPANEMRTAKDFIEQSDIPNLRRVVINDITADEFFSLFKRFSVELERNGLGLSGRQVTVSE